MLESGLGIKFCDQCKWFCPLVTFAKKGASVTNEIVVGSHCAPCHHGLPDTRAAQANTRAAQANLAMIIEEMTAATMREYSRLVYLQHFLKKY
jgi:hypothetical protein